MASLGSWLKNAMIKEPVVMWSVYISAVGIVLPAVVPPIRDALNPPKPVQPPSSSQVVAAMTGKS